MLQTLLAIKAFSLICRANFYCQSSLNIQSENQIKFLQSLGNHLFMETQSKPFNVFKVVSTQEPNLPWFFSNKNYGWHTRTAEGSVMPFWYVFFHVLCGLFFLCLMAKTDEVSVWCAVFPSEGLELAWNTEALIFSESRRKSWHSTKRSFGPFCNCLFKATVPYQNKSNRNLQLHLSSVSPIKLCFFSSGFIFLCVTWLPFFPFCCSLHFSHISKHMKNHPSFRSTKNVMHNTLL